MFAAKAGAKFVYAVDACPTICKLAEELIKCNRLQEKIRVMNKRIEDIERFDENIDIIISEWMGKILYLKWICQRQKKRILEMRHLCEDIK
jgi:predicted RNA methylase